MTGAPSARMRPASSWVMTGLRRTLPGCGHRGRKGQGSCPFGAHAPDGCGGLIEEDPSPGGTLAASATAP